MGLNMSVTVRRAAESDRDTLYRLWEVCFGEGADVFFDKRFRPENTLIGEVDNELAGAAHLLPCTVTGKKGYYGYGIGTFNEYRGLGVCRSIHRHINEMCKKEGSVYLLHPADESLYKMYRGFGLHGEIYGKRLVFKAGGRRLFTEVSPEEYASARVNHFTGTSSVQWDRTAVEYAVYESEGFCLKHGDIYFLCSVSEGRLKVLETTAGESELSILGDLCTETGTMFGEVILPPWYSTGVKMLWGLGFNVREDVYLNLVMG